MHTTTRRSLVLDESGGPALEVRHLSVDDRQPGVALAYELRVVCGSLDRTSGPGGYCINGHRGCWRCLRDVSSELVTSVVRRTERSYPGWRLPPGDDIHERVDRFLSGG
jgi:hypothetical protein